MRYKDEKGVSGAKANILMIYVKGTKYELKKSWNIGDELPDFILFRMRADEAAISTTSTNDVEIYWLSSKAFV